MKYTISAFSKLTGVSVDSLRHYERCGLLSPAVNPENGYRIYSERDALTLYTIKMYRGLHMPLAEISRYFHQGSFSHTQEWLCEKSRQLDEEIARLQSLRSCYSMRLLSIDSAAQPQGVVSELTLPPACHLYYDDCKNDESADTQELMQRWARSIPFVTHMLRLDMDAILAGKEAVPHLGLGSRLRTVEEFGLPITPPARLYTGGRGLRMHMTLRDPFSLGIEDVRPMLDHAERNRLRMSGDAICMIDAMDIVDGRPLYYVDLHFQVKTL